MDKMGGRLLVNKVLVLLVIAAVAGAAVGGLWLLFPEETDAAGHSAIRSFSATSVAPGGTVTVTIRAMNYGEFGRVVENIPDGFGGGTETLRLLGKNQTVDYTVTAGDSPGRYSFSGTITDEDGNSMSVDGVSAVTITASATATAVRSMPATVRPGGTVTVTIRAMNYGEFGRVVENIPDGFGGGTETLRLLGKNQTVDYTVTAGDSPGRYSFSGTITDEDGNNRSVDGASTVTITAPATATAVRSMPATVRPGGAFSVTIRARNYGKFGRVVETLPAGFTTPDAEGRTVTIRLVGEDQSESYTVTAPDTTGNYNFSGTLRDEDGDSYTVGRQAQGNGQEARATAAASEQAPQLRHRRGHPHSRRKIGGGNQHRRACQGHGLRRRHPDLRSERDGCCLLCHRRIVGPVAG